MILVVPELEHLASYRAALELGWSPSSVDGETERLRTLEKLAGDSLGFLASLAGESGGLEPIELPDGSTRPRLPYIVRWLWDGEFCGSIALRWQPGTYVLPDYVLGHIGYSIVEWKRGRGYATQALREMLSEARARGLERVQISAKDTNRASWRVIEKAGGKLKERSTGGLWHEPGELIRRYVIDFTSD